MTRREFVKAVALMAAASLLWDGAVNGGRPETEEDDEPPHIPSLRAPASA